MWTVAKSNILYVMSDTVFKILTHSYLFQWVFCHQVKSHIWQIRVSSVPVSGPEDPLHLGHLDVVVSVGLQDLITHLITWWRHTELTVPPCAPLRRLSWGCRSWRSTTSSSWWPPSLGTNTAKISWTCSNRKCFKLNILNICGGPGPQLPGGQTCTRSRKL